MVVNKHFLQAIDLVLIHRRLHTTSVVNAFNRSKLVASLVPFVLQISPNVLQVIAHATISRLVSD